MDRQTYIELFKDPKWQRKRLEIMERDGFTCQSCFDTEKTLNVHHLIYFPNNKPWEYDDKFLITLCEECHKYEKDNINSVMKNLKESLARCHFLSYHINEIAEGFYYQNLPYPPEVKASILKFTLTDVEAVARICCYYFDRLSEKNGNKNKKELF